MNTRVRLEEGVLWKLLALSFAAHVAVLAAWPEARVRPVMQPRRAELAFVEVAPRAQVVTPPTPAKKVVAPPRARPSAPSKLAAAAAPSAVATPPLTVIQAPSPVALPVFTLPPQATGPAAPGLPAGPSSTGSDGADGPRGGLRSGDSEPSLVGEVRVPYPADARERGVEGSVKLRVTVDAAGAVQSVVVLSGPGFGLDEAARAALLKFRFKPAIRGGQAVGSTFLYTYTFALD